MVQIFIRELQMIFQTSNVFNGNGNMEELARQIVMFRQGLLYTVADADIGSLKYHL